MEKRDNMKIWKGSFVKEMEKGRRESHEIVPQKIDIKFKEFL